MYYQPEKFNIIVPVFQKDNYDVEITITNSVQDPDVYLAIVSHDDSLIFGEEVVYYVEGFIDGSGNKCSFGIHHMNNPDAVHQANVFINNFWDKEIDDKVKEVLQTHVVNQLDMKIEKTLSQVTHYKSMVNKYEYYVSQLNEAELCLLELETQKAGLI